MGIQTQREELGCVLFSCQKCLLPRRADKGIELVGSKSWGSAPCLPELFGKAVTGFTEADAVLFDIASTGHRRAVRNMVGIQLRISTATDPAAVAITSEDHLTKGGADCLFTELAHASLSPQRA